MRRNLIVIGVAIPLLLASLLFVTPYGGSSNENQISDITKVLNNHVHSDTITNDVAKSGKGDAISNILPVAEGAPGKTHTITLAAEKLSNELLAYKMVSYKVATAGSQGQSDITKRYSSGPTIPGPTIVVTEGDEVFLTILNNITGSPSDAMVSVHVHGVHYDINSDGSLMHINGVADQGAIPSGSFTYHWVAGPGTAGTWPYHDHTYLGINGKENKGLFGAVIVNPASGQVKALVEGDEKIVLQDNIKKDYVLYVGDDAFWGTEITPNNGKQTPLWTNPTLVAKKDSLVRFHLIAVGTDLHEFTITGGVQWLKPGTSDSIGQTELGPLENHVFTIMAKAGSYTYMDLEKTNDLEGMEGTFKVTTSNGSSIPSPIPEPF
jgi:FtsP/CotA-like multicopper oxidase with cupredoxin domain